MGAAKARGTYEERKANPRGTDYGYKPMTGIVAVQWGAAIRAQRQQRHDAWNAYTRQMQEQRQRQLAVNERVKSLKAAA
jgi:plastocyanin domain-containing protein